MDYGHSTLHSKGSDMTSPYITEAVRRAKLAIKVKRLPYPNCYMIDGRFRFHHNDAVCYYVWWRTHLLQEQRHEPL